MQRMAAQPIAHTRNQSGERHTLAAHLQGVADLTAGFAEKLDAGQVGYYLGLWHDLGKISPEFQRYLVCCEANPGLPSRGPDHKAAGARLALRLAGSCALVVQGHHGGLRSPSEFKQWLGAKSCDEDTPLLTIAADLLSEYEPRDRLNPPAHAQGEPLSAEFFLRLLFSALVDADYLDTERHFSPERFAARGHAHTMSALWERIRDDQEHLLSVSTGHVNEARRNVYEACVRAAHESPGLFRLTVPTGGGKTRSAMAFALRHASLYEQQRVIVAVPFVSITEQTADVYRSIFDLSTDDRDPVVLEHHSGAGAGFALDTDRETLDQDQHPEATWRRLSCENWDAPLIVTTTVQLFESMFASRPARARKLHRLARSVIVLDEVQSLPPHLLAPSLDALSELCKNYGSTVLLCTATQPAFEAIPEFRDLPARDIVSDPGSLFAGLRRVRYEWRSGAGDDWSQVADLMAAESQALAITNTKKDALALLDALNDGDALHLSTLLCGAHRRMVLDEVRRRLRAGKPCRLVSTQVVEAGVDLDFPLVLRAMGPLDAIIQAAGRCNREGLREFGRVVVFEPRDGSMPPGVYKTGAGITRAILGQGALDLDTPEAPLEYFRRLFQTIETDREGIQRLRRDLNFPEVSRRFKLIDDDQEVVVVTTFGSDSDRRRVRRLLDSLRFGTPNGRAILRELQPYSVSVRSRVASGYLARGFISPVSPGLGEWQGSYHPVLGLSTEEPSGLII